MNLHTKLVRAMIRGDEVAFAKAAANGEYHEGPWKTPEQLWYDFQQVEREVQETTHRARPH